MNDETDTSKCIGARKYYDAQLAEDTTGETLTPGVKAEMEAHLTKCHECILWQRQITDIIALASHIPQFDVPEALTQRIMSVVAEESTKKESITATIAMFAVGLATMVILSFFGFESTNGLASWGLGLLAMIGFAWLVTDTKPEVIAHQGS